ncbi:MarR family transcriptional regulator [Streptomyces sp. NPDC048337]|uniref:MarR family transcriptional regulator n=1 Tax=Streptomyces sp. NPDC048337 TaxID=3365535 RepID=UPI00370F8468
MAAGKSRGLVLVDQATGEVVIPTPRTPHQFEGKGYTMQSKGAEVPLYRLGLTAAEWAILDWFKENGGAAGMVAVKPGELGEDIGSNESTAKRSLTRLVRIGLLVKASPRAGAYQLNPIRYWEGGGSAQLAACRRIDPPRIAPDAKANVKMAKTKTADEAAPSSPRSATGENR